MPWSDEILRRYPGYPEQVNGYDIAAPTGSVTCVACSQEKLRSKFFRIAPKSGPYKRVVTTFCLACKILQDTTDLKQETEERIVTKLGQEAQAMIRKELKEVKTSRRQIVQEERKRIRTAAKNAAKNAKRLIKQDVQEKETAKNAAKRIERTRKAAKTEAERELASRMLAKVDFLHYVERFHPDYLAGWVHEDICRRLRKFVEDVENKRSPRLILNMPPRHGKSMLASENFPSWVLGKHPEWEFIAASYNLDLPLKFSRRIRERVKSPDFRLLFPHTVLSPDSQASEMWSTTKHGGYRAAGVGGGITGLGAHVLVIDDPVKDAAEADSATIRQNVWDWYTSTAYTRLAPGGGILLIQTRWNDDDLSGRVEANYLAYTRELSEVKLAINERAKVCGTRNELDTQMQELKQYKQSLIDENDVWEIVKYPAVAEYREVLNRKTGEIVLDVDHDDRYLEVKMYKFLRQKGEPLHPERFGLNLLQKYKKTMQPRHWSALYQQNPIPDEGLFFTKDMLRFEPSVPNDLEDMHIYAAWDLAVGQRATNDYTVGIVGALDWKDDIHIIDMVRMRTDTHHIAEAILNMSKRYKVALTGIEKGPLELALRPQLEKLMAEQKYYPAFAEGNFALKPITDKVVRARPLQGRMQQGKIYLPSNQPWADNVIHELLRFPGGLHDDIVDALSWLVRMVMQQAPPPEPRHNRGSAVYASWKDRLKDIAGLNEKTWMSS